MTIVAELSAALPGRVLTAPDQLEALTRDASRAVPAGAPRAAMRARSTDDVVAAIRWARRHGVPVSVRGAGTGLSGGAVAYADGLVLALDAMDTILEIDPVDRLAVVEPGVTVARLTRAAAAHGLRYGPDPASAARCTIGGTIATNAGGLRCIALGVTRDAVAGLEVVTGAGEVMRTGSRTRKSSTGYELTGLFVGSEGTLGVVTRAMVRLIPVPQEPAVAFSAWFADTAQAVSAVSAVMAAGITPEMLELLDEECLALLDGYAPGTAPRGGALLLGEASREVAAAVAAVCRAGGARAVDQGDARLLEARTTINAALGAAGFAASCDVAVPVARLGEMLEDIRRIAGEEGVRVCTFAHAGDGNLHPALVLAESGPDALRRADLLFERIATAAVGLGGVVSGEHGIGSLKLHSARAHADPVAQRLAGELRRLFDPDGILTPGRGV